MKNPKPTPDGAIGLPIPPAAPEPADDCCVCSDLAEQRQIARGAGDYSRATDASVEIRRHPHVAEGIQ
ncbi:hypothetical protein EAO72_09805 [Streptomyces sp. or43]|nr:hypothetical protein EAO72_09805 [Streptomyces sp. or43]